MVSKIIPTYVVLSHQCFLLTFHKDHHIRRVPRPAPILRDCDLHRTQRLSDRQRHHIHVIAGYFARVR